MTTLSGSNGKTKVDIPNNRFSTIDWLRFVAIVEIAGFHSLMGRISIIDGLGLPLLLIITNLWNCTISDKRGPNQFIAEKWNRLFFPWIFWCFVYALIVIAETVAHGRSLANIFSLNIIIQGTYPHLWFVPFAIFSALLVSGMQWLTQTLPNLPIIFAAGTIGILLLALDPNNLLVSHCEVAGKWQFALPSIFLGFSVGRTLLTAGSMLRQRIIFIIMSMIFASIWGVSLMIDASDIWIRYSVSLLIVSVGLQFSFLPGRIITFLAPLTLGVYLTHAMFLRLFMAARLPRESSLLWAVGSVGLAVMFVWSLRHTPLRRFV